MYVTTTVNVHHSGKYSKLIRRNYRPTKPPFFPKVANFIVIRDNVLKKTKPYFCDKEMNSKKKKEKNYLKSIIIIIANIFVVINQRDEINDALIKNL